MVAEAERPIWATTHRGREANFGGCDRASPMLLSVLQRNTVVGGVGADTFEQLLAGIWASQEAVSNQCRYQTVCPKGDWEGEGFNSGYLTGTSPSWYTAG